MEEDANTNAGHCTACNTNYHGWAQLPNVAYCEKIKKYGMTFCDEVIADLGIIENIEKAETNLLIINNEFHKELSSIKILQVLNELEKFRTNNYLLTCLSDFIKLQRTIVQSLEKKERAFLLIIECDVEVIDVKKMDELCEVLKYLVNLPGKTLVLILKSKENHEFVKACKESVTSFKEISYDKNTFRHLSAKSQTDLLERKVTFQGIKIALKELIQLEQLKEIIDDETSFMLVTKQNITVGENLVTLGDVADYYISRSVIHRVNISPNVLRMDIPDLFAIDNVEESELIKIVDDGKKNFGNVENELVRKTLRIPLGFNDENQSSRKGLMTGGELYENIKLIHLVEEVNPGYKKLIRQYGEVDPNPEDPIRFIILPRENKSECFRQLCLDYPKHVIHWVEKADNKLIWQHSQGSLSNIRNYVDKNKETGDAFEPYDLTAIESKLIIVNGEPGMGKSCLLSRLALQTQELNPSLWIVRLNLPEIDEQLRNFNAETYHEIVEEGTINFLLNCKTLTNFVKNIFANALNIKEKVIFLFDGFDEIGSGGRAGVYKLLHYLKNKPIRKLWICIRPHSVNGLEDELSVFSHQLEPVSKPNQEILLKKIWKRNLNDFNDNDDHLFMFAKKCLNLFYENVHENEDRGFGIPFHIKMLADSFEKECKEVYLALNNSSKLPVKINVLDLYRRFVEIKLKLSFEVKVNGERSICLQRFLEEMRSRRIQIYQLLAVHSLFSDREISSAFSENERDIISQSIQHPEDNEVITEIIIDINNNMPVFIHSTFAEHFAACWFADNITRKEISQYFHSMFWRNDNQINYMNPILNQNFPGAFDSVSRMNCDTGRTLFDPEEDRNKIFRNFLDYILIDRAREHVQRYNLYFAVLTNDPEYLMQVLNEKGIKDIINSTADVGKTPLHLAVSNGYVNATKILLENMADVNICDDIFGWSALQYADAFMYWDIAACLLDKGAIGDHMYNAINTMKRGNNSLIHVAVEFDSLALVKILTENGASLNALDIHGNSALHNATRKGRLDLLQYFVNVEGADFSQFNKDGFAPVHIAAEYLNFDIIKCIMNSSIRNIDQRSKSGFTALQLIIISDDKNKVHNSLDVVKYLLEISKAHINVETTIANMFLLHIAAAYGKLEIVQYLIEKQNADCISNDSDGWTPTHYAAVMGNLDIVKYFLEVKKVDLNISTDGNRSLVHLAAESGNLNLIKYLLEEQNASCISVDYDGWTPAHEAAFNGNLDVVKYFLEVKKVCLNIETGDEESLLNLAAQSGNLNLIKYLVEEQNASCISVDSTGRTPAHCAALNGNLDVVKYLLVEKKVDLNILTDGKKSLVHLAAHSGNLNLIKYLVEEQIASCISVDSKGRTPAHLAARAGKLDIVKYFLEVKKVDLNILTDAKKSLVHYAAESGDLNFIKYLVEEQNASCISVDSIGRTPAHFAAAEGNLDIVKYFLEVKNVDSNILTQNKQSLIHFAAENSDLNFIKYLVEEQNATCISVDSNGQTPAHYAALVGKLDIVKYILEVKMVDLNLLMHVKQSLVRFDTKIYYLDLIKYLVEEQNASCISVDSDGRTPVHDAALAGELDIVKYFLEIKKVDLNILTDDKQSLVHCAAQSGDLHLIEYLVEERNASCITVDSKGWTPAHHAALAGKLYIVKYFLEVKKVDLNILTDDDQSLVHLASLSGNLNLVNYLVGMQNASCISVDSNGCTSEFTAALVGILNNVRYLFRCKKG